MRTRTEGRASAISVPTTNGFVRRSSHDGQQWCGRFASRGCDMPCPLGDRRRLLAPGRATTAWWTWNHADPTRAAEESCRITQQLPRPGGFHRWRNYSRTSKPPSSSRSRNASSRSSGVVERSPSYASVGAFGMTRRTFGNGLIGRRRYLGLVARRSTTSPLVANPHEPNGIDI